jgi:hypothetical protein
MNLTYALIIIALAIMFLASSVILRAISDNTTNPATKNLYTTIGLTLAYMSTGMSLSLIILTIAFN